ncbi:MAG: hypothetical protein H3C31_02425 [Brumimicrobium sp.]|nr:hypothetical protein [Brumimicrobium sp.]
MKKNSVKSLALIATVGVLATGCDLLKDVDYTITPNPLEMHGDSVRVKAEITIPEKGIKKKVYAEVTPAVGSHALKPISIVGEKATANGTVIPFKAGGKVVYEDIIAYAPDMEVSELTVSGKVYKKGKVKEELEPTKVADATIVTPFLVNKDFKVIIAKDEFQRVTDEKQIAEINYLKGNAAVRPTEKVDADMKAMADFLAAAQTNPKIDIQNINIEAFASIEGEENKNNTLSSDRAESAKKAAIEIASQKKVANEKAKAAENYSTVGKGEDFVGFKNALVASTMDKGDKDLILRILDMQQSPEAREQAIRDLSTYLYLDKNIFPAQRRAEIVVNYKLTGYSDEELVELSKTNIDALKLEEILFTATLTQDLNEKMRLYKEAERLFPQDYRTANNVGVIYYMQNDLDQAKTQFDKANSIQENVISKNNLAAIAGVKGDRDKAKALLDEAKGAGSEVSYNKGILNIQDGKYDDAISNFGSDASFNKALAYLLNKNEGQAKSTIESAPEVETAKGYYLQAIIAAHESNLDAIVSNLKKAFTQDASLKNKAATDREFIKYLENAAFTAIVK